jgi:hypothetical protein
MKTCCRALAAYPLSCDDDATLLDICTKRTASRCLPLSVMEARLITVPQQALQRWPKSAGPFVAADSVSSEEFQCIWLKFLMSKPFSGINRRGTGNERLATS